MRKSIAWFVVCIMAAAVVTGCGDLSRSKAANMIKHKMIKNNEIQLNFEFGPVRDNVYYSYYDEQRLAETTRLKEKGFIGYLEKVHTFGGIYNLNFSLTKNISPYLVGNSFVIGQLEDVQVTGMKKDGNSIRVNYSCVYKVTKPLGEIMANGNPTITIADSVADFEKYDDGWRLR